MLDRIKRLFAAVGVDSPPAEAAAGVDELHLAAAALLAEVALGDDRFDAAERAATQRLVEAAEGVARESTHLLRFTRVVKDNFSPAERVELIEMIWEVVYADGERHAYEDSLMRRIAGLIYVSDRERGAARRRALARLGLADRGVSG